MATMRELLNAYDEARRTDEAAGEPNNSGNMAGDELADGVRQLLADNGRVMFSEDEMRSKPVRITGNGEIFIGDEQILAEYPIAEGSISVTRWRGRLNQLTLTLLVGPASMELRDKPRVDTDADDARVD